MQALVISCDASSPAAIRDVLDRSGCRAEFVPVSVDMVAIVGGGRYDVVVIDAAPAEASASTLCRELRRSKSGTPILVLMGTDSSVARIAALDAGADDCLAKPFVADELAARLRCLMRRSKGALPTILRAGDLELNIDEHHFVKDGVPVKLSAKEFALLEFMMRNPNKLLTRSMISESVWDMNYDMGSNVIDVYVSSLRRKVDRGRSERCIQTVVGSGYRFLPSPGASSG